MKRITALTLGIALSGGCVNQPKIEHSAKPAITPGSVATPIGDPHWGLFPGYMDKMETAVQTEWDKIIEKQKQRPPPGSIVKIVFVLSATGNLQIETIVKSVQMTDQGIQDCVAALRGPAPYDRWTDKMIASLGTEQKLTFTFVYE